jgi:nitric oxide reductase NorD protein
VLQRERHGTLFADVENQLSLTLRALWQMNVPLQAFATGCMDWQQRRQRPHHPALEHAPERHSGTAGVTAVAGGEGTVGATGIATVAGGSSALGSICLPDVYDDYCEPSTARAPVSGLDRYRVALAHIAAHRRWSQPWWPTT